MARAAAVATDRFNGFPEGGIDFFLQLEAEQSRTWFKAHQDDFERFWKRPLELFVTELQARLEDAYPGLDEVTPHYFRIQRDTRFARDKSPYKTYVAADLPIRPAPHDPEQYGHGVPGLYCSFGLESDYIGVGSWHLSPEKLGQYRVAVDHAKDGPRLQKLVDDLTAHGFNLSSMESLKRTPPPYPQDHPRAELLKRKGLAAGIQIPDGLLQSRDLLDWTDQHLRLAQPLVAWLDKHLS